MPHSKHLFLALLASVALISINFYQLPPILTTSAQTASLISNLSATSGRAYQVMDNALTRGAGVYTDRSYTYTAIPASLENATYIKTANDDKSSTGSSFLSFTLNQDASVYVAHMYASTHSSKPAWLDNTWTATGETLINTDRILYLYKKNFNIGTVTLGGNNGAPSMYTVVVAVPLGASSSDTTPPSTPTNLSATAISSSQINLSWTASTDNIAVTNYRLERCQGSSCANFTQIATPTGTTYNDTGLSANTTYRYRVRAEDAAGNLSGYSSTTSGTTQTTSSPSQIPETFPSNASDWTEQGVVIIPGTNGSWDDYTSHGFELGSVVEKDGIYYLYYTGTNGPRSDGGPAFRAIGVATSADGVNFTKYAGNPIITHAPSVGHCNHEEEGAEEVSVTMDANGNFVAYWGALSAVGCSQVKTDIHVSTSSDGFNFVDQGVVIPGKNSTNSGDEAWPAGVLHAGGSTSDRTGQWHLWFVQDGWGYTTGMATGDIISNLSLHPNNPVLAFNNKTDRVWPIAHPSGKVTFIIQEGDGWTGPVRIRTADVNSLDTYSAPITLFSNSSSDRIYGAVVVPDTNNNIWRMYYTRAIDSGTNMIEFRLKTAPFGTTLPDTTPPTTPTNLQATSVSSSQINLSWTASTDNVGITNYRVERCQGSSCTSFAQVAIPAGTSYSDTGLSANIAYRYRIRTEDAAGNLSGYSSIVSATTQSSPSTKFQIGDRVEVFTGDGSNLNIRNCASPSCSSLGMQQEGNQGTVIGGPQTADGFTWWNINYDTAPDGWSVEDFLIDATLPPGDTTPPAVSITDPGVGDTVSGTTVVSAFASDNVGVAGVQFLLNGANLGAEDISAPYSISWDTATITDGSYTLTARARDAAGNTAVSAGVIVLVDNQSANDTTPPTIPTGLTGSAVGPTQVFLSWNASTDNVAVLGYNIYRDSVAIANTDVTSFSDTFNLMENTTYTYYVTAFDGTLVGDEQTQVNESGPSNSISITTMADAAIFNVSDTHLQTHTDLIPNFVRNFTIRSVQNGNWTDPSTWNPARVPSSSDIVLIEHTVTYQSTVGNVDAIGVNAGGVFRFSSSQNTTLRVATIQVLPNGVMEVGTPVNPMPANLKAEIIIKDKALDLTDDGVGVFDPAQFGTSILVIDGTFTVHGAVKNPTWVRLAREPRAGDTTLLLESTVSGWRPGDRLILPETTKRKENEILDSTPRWEELFVESFSGTTVTLTQPIQYDTHRGAYDASGVLRFLPHVGNLSRNVIIRSENPNGTRGHTLYANRAFVNLRYAEFNDLGRTSTDPLDSTVLRADGSASHIGGNQIARYPVHTHHLSGPKNLPASVPQFVFEGLSVDGGVNASDGKPKWGMTIHGSHFGLIKQNVVFRAQGAAIVTEDGNESQNVFEENFTIGNLGSGDASYGRSNIQDFGHDGSGIWLRGPDNYVRGNVSVNATKPGMTFVFIDIPKKMSFGSVIPIRFPAYKGAGVFHEGEYVLKNVNNIPVRLFENNEVYSSGFGMVTFEIGAKRGGAIPSIFNIGESIVKDFRSWHVGCGLQPRWTNNFTMQNFIVLGDPSENQSGEGICYSKRMVRNLTIRNAEFQGLDYALKPSNMSDGWLDYGGGNADSTTFENIYLRNEIDAKIHSPWLQDGASDQLAPRKTIFRNVQFNGDIAIEIEHNPRRNYNLNQTDETFVYDYNGNQNDDFQVFYSEQATRDWYGGQAPCTDTTTHPEISGITCSFIDSSGDTTPPTTPANLSSPLKTSSSISLAWSPSTDTESGVSSYRIYRCQGTTCTPSTQIGTSNTTSFTDSSLLEGTTYRYHVSAINGAGLESSKSSILTISTSADTTPPTISSVSATNANTISVIFSEPIEQSSSQTISNYTINNSITVSNASLQSDLTTVILTTSSLSEGITYTLTINNVKDRATTPNTIAPNSQKTFTFTAQLIISNLSTASSLAYEIVPNGLQNGADVYIDRTFTFSSVPPSLQGSTYIKTANNDKSSTGTSFLSFNVNQNVTVYVAHDDRSTAKPSWMSTYTDSGLNLITTDTTFSLYQKDFTQGTITLGGNDFGGGSMYIPVIVPQGGTPPTNKFNLNDRVQVQTGDGSSLNVRSCASTSCASLGTQQEGNQGTVIGGPQTADGFTWWNINYDNGADGWSVESFLTKAPLLGDLNQDGMVNNLDWAIMSAVWFTADATADLNSDGIVNSIDFSLMNGNWGKTSS